MTFRNSTLTLGSTELILDTYEVKGTAPNEKHTVRRFQVERQSADPDDLAPFEESIPFGAFGMGQSLFAGRNQIDYSLDCDTEQMGQLGPGPDKAKIGLALDNPVNLLRTARDSGTTESAFAGTVADDSAVGTVAWTNPTNAQGATDDGVYATATSGGSFTTHYLKCTNFGFTIPTTSTVLGMLVAIDAKTSTGTFGANNISTRPYKSGALAGTATTGSSSNTITTTEGFVIIVGGTGPGTTWSTSFTPAEVNDSGFGVGISLVSATAGTTYSIDRVRVTVFYTPANKYLYAVSANSLTKLNLRAVEATAIFSTVETKSFTHGDNGVSAPGITDMAVLKDGAGPSVAELRPANVAGDGLFIVGFGAEAQIQQCDRIASASEPSGTTDTYHTLNGTKAYGGVFTTALSTTNTERVVWKSVGVDTAGTGVGAIGAFHQVQSAQVKGSTTDYTAAATWTPSTAYKVGDFGASITGMCEYQRGLLVAKPEGVYAFDQNYNAYKAISFGVRGDENGRHLLPFQSSLLINNRQDVQEHPARGDSAIGLSTLQSNLSPVQGYPTAVATYDRAIFISYYDGTDSYICKLRRRQSENAPTEFLVFPLFKVASHKVRTMLVTDDGLTTGNVYLFWDTTSATANKYDIGYLILDPPSARTYESGGQIFLPRKGSAMKRTVIEEIDLYGVGLSATAKWTVGLSWDEGAFADLATEATSVGRNRIQLVAGTNDSGFMYQIRLTCTNNTNTNNPRLRGSAIGANGPMGEVNVKGQRQGDEVDRLTFIARVAQGDITDLGNQQYSTPQEIFTTLTAMVGAGLQNFTYNDYLNGSTVKVLVKSVSYVEGVADSRENATRRVRIVCSRVRST